MLVYYLSFVFRCKFGQLGPGKGQFNSPHGFCLGIDEDIVVADTNNHRVCCFEKTGEFKYQFGIPGKFRLNRINLTVSSSKQTNTLECAHRGLIKHEYFRTGRGTVVVPQESGSDETLGQVCGV